MIITKKYLQENKADLYIIEWTEQNNFLNYEPTILITKSLIYEPEDPIDWIRCMEFIEWLIRKLLTVEQLLIFDSESKLIREGAVNHMHDAQRSLKGFHKYLANIENLNPYLEMIAFQNYFEESGYSWCSIEDLINCSSFGYPNSRHIDNQIIRYGLTLVKDKIIKD